ncbi:MAG: crossover junction endodeoxyribonuclease RuvC [Candidatus Zambryskibacteria bacterium CG10_big_fil_rev_8_21_14_0_10_34_34]|uniref:Crossover junction endodeoxyribonuclease RuvC n=1 Tax=Candidatus Zambryskibacteria bacterium CG10_big_fil_rev_8_21_14_0_10_34_34 TaxID=1975114 RepID=A0A2H0R0X2_9BACT|nr:MAG: crossover junction endodeoxyribonuclease RuvC [Candidatus Zambryskibacteria bacterium CG10_big_fil_rev_8_21_14_0_10_34_34]
MKNKKNLNTGYQLLTTRILGIDPGYGRIGIAVIEKTNKEDNLIHSECFETEAKLLHHERLLALGEKIKTIIKKYQPQKIAIETLLWSKNKKTAFQVAEARGVILFEAAKSGCLICEYNPNQIKLAVTGYGKSDKKQIINMVGKLVKLDIKNRYDDEYDAIATAITCSAISLSTDIRI